MNRQHWSSLARGPVFATALLLLSGFYSSSHAEPYIGFYGGGSFNNKLAKLKGDENVNYPNPPGPGDLFKGTTVDDAKLYNSFLFGAKAGRYLKSRPFLGFEVEFDYSKPNFKEQVLALRHSDFGEFKELQLKADIQKFTTAFNVLLRYDGFDSFKPYVGIGPSLNYIKIKGTGRSGILEGENPSDPSVGVNGPDINEKTWALGGQVKIGAQFPVTNNFAIDFEYKYVYVPIEVNNFRSLKNPEANIISNQAVLALVYRFKN